MSDPKPPLTERELMDEQLAQLQKSDREMTGPRRRFTRIRVPKHGTADASPSWPLVLVSVLVPLLGWIIGVVYVCKDDPADRQLGTRLLVYATLAFAYFEWLSDWRAGAPSLRSKGGGRIDPAIVRLSCRSPILRLWRRMGHPPPESFCNRLQCGANYPRVPPSMGCTPGERVNPEERGDSCMDGTGK